MALNTGQIICREPTHLAVDALKSVTTIAFELEEPMTPVSFIS